MEIKVDLKSLVIGLCLGVILVMTIAAVNSEPQKSSESGAGRFKMIVADKRAYILDSQTGRPWTTPSDARSDNFNRETFWRSKLEIYEDELAVPDPKNKKR